MISNHSTNSSEVSIMYLALNLKKCLMIQMRYLEILLDADVTYDNTYIEISIGTMRFYLSLFVFEVLGTIRTFDTTVRSSKFRI